MDRDKDAQICRLRSKLELALAQRDNFARNYHQLARIPHQEQHEIMVDCDAEISKLGGENVYTGSIGSKSEKF